MRMFDVFMGAKAQIWGYESQHCTIVQDVSSGKFYAECDEILSRRALNSDNYVQVLNDMFCDYCTEKAAWMGMG